MKYFAFAVAMAIVLIGFVEISRAGASTQPTAADMILLADRSTEELRCGINSADAAIHVVSENLASAKTTAFKRCDALPRGDGGADIRINLDQGVLNSTGRPLDVGISGAGFFKVKVDDNIGNGFAYTRNGNFYISSNSELMIGMGSGYRLDPPITLPRGVTSDCVQISEEGEIFVRIPGRNVKTQIGQFQLTTFANSTGLKHLGGSLYQETDQSDAPIEGTPGENATGKVISGYLEGSNVSIEQEKLRLKKLRQWRKVMTQAAEERD